MGNTHISLPALSAKIYKEWYPKTVLVQSCDDAFEGELNIETRELDIPCLSRLIYPPHFVKRGGIKTSVY